MVPDDAPSGSNLYHQENPLECWLKDHRSPQDVIVVGQALILESIRPIHHQSRATNDVAGLIKFGNMPSLKHPVTACLVGHQRPQSPATAIAFPPSFARCVVLKLLLKVSVLLLDEVECCSSTFLFD